MAPKRPKQEREDQELDDAAGQVMTFTLDREIKVGKGDNRRTLPKSHYLAINLLTMDDKIAVRAATGLPFEMFVGDVIGEDSMLVLWWLARRKTAEPLLSFQAAKAQWPSDLTADEVEINVGPADSEADDPEA